MLFFVDADYGKRCDLHFLKAQTRSAVCRYQGSNSNDRVEKVIYDPLTAGFISSRQF
jgi:hypothetical protein